jgi:TetR/AcrR family transcriptional regulator, cholesterol catabolism regulator
MAEVTLTGAQAARRQRVIDAAMELGAEGGYDAVQMRDVAARAQVAMGTVYRYFSSKDHVLAAALAGWAEALEGRLAQVPPRGATPADRVADVLRRAVRGIDRKPRMMAAMVSALSSLDQGAVACQHELDATMERIIRRAIGEPEPADVTDIIRIIEHVWFSSLLSWMNGRSDVQTMGSELEVAARLLLRDSDGSVRRGRSA